MASGSPSPQIQDPPGHPRPPVPCRPPPAPAPAPRRRTEDRPPPARATQQRGRCPWQISEDPTHAPTPFPPPSAPTPLSTRIADWIPTRRDVRRALRRSNDSAPGPDGIPYAAWRRLGEAAVGLLFGALRQLHRDSAADRLRVAHWDEAGPGYHSFNHSLLYCLPKKPSGQTANGDPMYAPANTRPLCVANTDNRLIASAVKYRWEPLVGRHITDQQQGFLTGRNILVDIL